MKWIFIVGGVLVALVSIIVIVGALLPRDHVASASARIAASPEQVWQTITDVDAHPSWRSDVQRVETLADVEGRPSWREHSSNGAITMVVARTDAPHHLTTRIADANLPFGGTWDYDIEPDGSGSRLTITEHGSVYNPIFRFVSHFMLGHHATMNTYLRSLSRKFGQESAPEAVAVRGGN